MHVYMEPQSDQKGLLNLGQFSDFLSESFLPLLSFIVSFQHDQKFLDPDPSIQSCLGGWEGCVSVWVGGDITRHFCLGRLYKNTAPHAQIYTHANGLIFRRLEIWTRTHRDTDTEACACTHTYSESQCRLEARFT